MMAPPAKAAFLLWLVTPTVTVTAQPPVEIEWVRIPSGTYQRGCVPTDADCLDNERPRHEVTISEPFELMTTEVTVRQYLTFSQVTGSRLPRQPRFRQTGEHPIVHVTWFDAFRFCEWAGARLPTEAEWEYAARGGAEGRIFWWGDEFSPARVNFNDEGCCPGDPWVNTAPVGSFPANGFGLHDMSGNVWEWVGDWFDLYPSSRVIDPRGAATGQVRMARGGSWFNPPRVLRVSARLVFDPSSQTGNVGARCARALPGIRVEE